VVGELAKTFATMTRAELQARLDAAGVPNGPINNLQQVFDMPQAKERGLKVTVPRSDGVPVAGVGNPIRLSATPVEYRTAAPKLGEHTDAVLAEWLDANADAIRGLRASGALGTA
jgi:crotonobetainyl-CoA:carnitine CoA-transferase CaiB-like acyl-CoA transferase